ncbi:cellulose binding domain-containing protein [Alteromonadaceae bacterium 2753L.S.0a.02]|nr:cellulose binding domain-containing protein [Alteromonadaceae bacterium 2753L.S.0a.02]
MLREHKKRVLILSAALPLLVAGHGMAQSSSSSSSSTSSSTSTSTSSSGGVGGSTWSISMNVCPDISDGSVIVAGDDDRFEFDTENLLGSRVYFQPGNLLGGPELGRGSVISYANGSTETLTMKLETSLRVLVEEVSFPPTGGWDVWSTIELPGVIATGTITQNEPVSLVSLDPAGGPHLSVIHSWISIDTSGSWGGGYGTEACPDDTPPEPPVIECDTGTPSVWGDGYVLSNMTLTNSGETTVNGWTLYLDFIEAPQAEHWWNAEMIESANILAVRPLEWNRRLEPGDSISFGVMGKHNGNFAVPECTVLISDVE